MIGRSHLKNSYMEVRMMTKKEVRTKRIADGFRGGKVPPIKPDNSHWESEQDKNEAMASSLGHILDGLAMDLSCE